MLIVINTYTAARYFEDNFKNMISMEHHLINKNLIHGFNNIWDGEKIKLSFHLITWNDYCLSAVLGRFSLLHHDLMASIWFQIFFTSIISFFNEQFLETCVVNFIRLFSYPYLRNQVDLSNSQSSKDVLWEKLDEIL